MPRNSIRTIMSKQPRSKEDKRVLEGVNLLKDNDKKVLDSENIS